MDVICPACIRETGGSTAHHLQNIQIICLSAHSKDTYCSHYVASTMLGAAMLTKMAFPPITKPSSETILKLQESAAALRREVLSSDPRPSAFSAPHRAHFSALWAGLSRCLHLELLFILPRLHAALLETSLPFSSSLYFSLVQRVHGVEKRVGGCLQV